MSEMKIGVNKTCSTEFLQDSSASECRKMTGLREKHSNQCRCRQQSIASLHCEVIRRASPLDVVAVESGIADDRPTVNLRRRGDPIDRLMKKYRAVLGSHGAALRLAGRRCGGRTFYSNSILLFLFGRDLRMRRPRSALTSGC